MDKLCRVFVKMTGKDKFECKVLDFEVKNRTSNMIIVWEDEWKKTTKRIKNINLESPDTLFNDFAPISLGYVSYRAWCEIDRVEETKEKLKDICKIESKKYIETCEKFIQNFKN